MAQATAIDDEVAVTDTKLAVHNHTDAATIPKATVAKVAVVKAVDLRFMDMVDHVIVASVAVKDAVVLAVDNVVDRLFGRWDDGCLGRRRKRERGSQG